MFIIYLVSCLVLVRGEAAKDEKDQFCTDPRTMNKHAAYTEWADAYSCTRHRCQPGGRNLAIYTVGCKRVEAPESAIECEEVVEDTNMQFPYCCVRLRCLVVVRGEVWTRVLGQPWETLPAAPWSHMYKMKKPPPVDDAQSKGMAAGPIYELSDASEAQKPPEGPEPMMRSNKDNRDKPTAHGANVPDVVIALTTNKDKKQDAVESGFKPRAASMEFDRSDQHESEGDEGPIHSEKDTTSDEGYPNNRDSRGHKSWTRVSQDQRASRAQLRVQESDPEYEKQVDSPTFLEMSEEKAEDKPGLQSLVDAIGTRMRDIENVVQRMSEQVGPLDPEGNQDRVRARDPDEQAGKNLEAQVLGKRKRANPDMYNRLPSRPQGSSYLQSLTTEPPLFVEDANLHGYFSDPSNTMMRRSNRPKEPAETYMAPIDTSHKATPESNEPSIKHKKRSHKKKKSKRGKKKHRRDDAEEKKFNKIAPDLENNVVSVEDSNDFGKA